jgi:hypothetical protein
MGGFFAKPSTSTAYWERLEFRSAVDGAKNMTEDAGTWAVGGDLTTVSVLKTMYNSGGGDAAQISKANVKVPTTGTYSIITECATNNEHGIMETYEGANLLGTDDLYSSGEVRSVWAGPYDMGSLTAGTAYTIKFKVNGKNASSSSYNIDPIRFIIYRTG